MKNSTLVKLLFVLALLEPLIYKIAYSDELISQDTIWIHPVSGAICTPLVDEPWFSRCENGWGTGWVVPTKE